MLELENGYVGHDEARASVAKADLGDDERAKVEQLLTNLEFRDILSSTDPKDMPSGGAKFYVMLQQDRVPNNSQLTSFWQYMFAWAAAEKDVELFERLIAEARKRHPDDKRLQRYLPQLERQLEAMRGAGK